MKPAESKYAIDEGAHVVLIDERGFFVNPTFRRTWAPRGRMPVLTGAGRRREKVSTITAVSVALGGGGSGCTGGPTRRTTSTPVRWSHSCGPWCVASRGRWS